MAFTRDLKAKYSLNNIRDEGVAKKSVGKGMESSDNVLLSLSCLDMLRLRKST